MLNRSWGLLTVAVLAWAGVANAGMSLAGNKPVTTFFADRGLAAAQPVFNPTGTTIAFYSSTYYGLADVWTMHPDGTSLHELTDGTGYSETPSFTQDGQHILYSDCAVHEGSHAWNIWEMDPDGANKHALTSGPPLKALPRELPDGRIVYHSWYPVSLRILDGENDYALPHADSGFSEHCYPSVSPDGKYLVYKSGAAYGQNDVYLYDLTAQSEKRLTTEPSWQGDPSFSPDGNSIVYASDEGGDGYTHLWRMDLNGQNRQQLTSGNGNDRFPQFSPDRKTLAYSRVGSGWASEIWTANVVPELATLSYNPAQGRLSLDTHGDPLNGFILTSPGSFTGSASIPPGFTFSDDTSSMISAQMGNKLTGAWDFGDGSAVHGADYRDWSFTYTVNGIPGVFTGQIDGFLPGDVNMDGKIDAYDIQNVLGANSYKHGTGWTWAEGDFNGDGLVNEADIQLVLDVNEYGKGSYRTGSNPVMAYDMAVSVGYVPEPATLSLLALGGLAMLRRRK